MKRLVSLLLVALLALSMVPALAENAESGHAPMTTEEIT